MRWSRLRALIKELFAEELDIDIQLTVFRNAEGRDVGRYVLTLNKERLFEYPPDVERRLAQNIGSPEIGAVTALLREYLDTPKAELFEKRFTEDRWGITDLLKAADRRVGKRRLADLTANLTCPDRAEHVVKVLRARGVRTPESRS